MTASGWRRRLTALRTSLARPIEWAGESPLGEAARRFVDLEGLTMAGALAFYAVLSMAPLVLLLMWLTAILHAPAQDEFFRQIRLLSGHEAEAVARTIVESAERGNRRGQWAGLWSTLALFIGASTVFAQLQTSLNRIFRTDARRLGGMLAWLRKRLFSFGIVISLGFLLVVSMIVQALLQMMIDRVPGLLPVVSIVASLALYAGAFAVMYGLLPDRRIGWRQALTGGTLTAVLFLVGRELISLYLGRASLASAYGPAGALVLMLLWVYYSAMVFFAGALVTAVMDERRRAREREPTPERNPQSDDRAAL